MYRGEASTEDMIVSTICTTPLDREHIEVLLRHHEEVRVTTLISADTAECLIVVHIPVALRAEGEMSLELSDRSRELLGIASRSIEEKKCKLESGLISDTREEGKGVLEALESFRQHAFWYEW